ncbi:MULTISPECIES: hypothetical protein [Nostocales]|nr:MULTISPECIES: hypothetical protein [Nostocales]
MQQRITDFIIRHNDSAQPIKWSYTVAQMMEKFAHVLMRSRLKQI